MITRVTIPKADANMEEATVGRWLKPEGTAVRRNDPLVELITDKAAFELESPASGVLRRIIARPKSVLPVGYIIGLIGGAGDALPNVEAENQRILDERRRQWDGERKPDREKKPATPAGPRAVRATPAARRLAREKNLDIALVQSRTGVEVVTEDAIAKYLEMRPS